ncbi:MAG: SpoIVB peptidase [Clostridia bacterium]|nr:SpoIVB peptidase [Clostridia bacterium]
MKQTVKFSLILLIALSLLATPAGSDEGGAEELVRAVPGGAAIGLKLYLDGLLVVGFSDIPSNGGQTSPGRNAGIRKGDRIIAINDKNIENIRDFSKTIQDSSGKDITLTVERDNKIFKKSMSPVYYNDAGQYKLGIWVRDSAAGIGTVSFMLDDGRFAALGHGISDADTEELITVSSGEVTGSNISSVIKGKPGVPGELRGAFDNSAEGEVLFNSADGIYGTLTKHTLYHEPLEIEKEKNVTEGNAIIYSSVDGNEIEEFEVEVQKVMRYNNSDGKCMVIKVTDARLLSRTGGIVQGMSGSPVIKDGKIIGAVTHVFLNDPTKGYAIFAERMLNSLKKENK